MRYGLCLCWRRSRIVSLLLILATVLLHGAAHAVIPLPKFDPQQKEVTDLTGTLTPDQTRALVQKIRALETSDGTQIAVLMVPTTDGEAAFDLAQRTATAWGIGEKGRNNGVLLVIAKDDRKDHVHVGYGLEGRLTDALSSRILRNEIHPAFKEGRFYDGIDRGITAIIAAIRGEYKAPEPKSGGDGGGGEFGFWIVILVLGFIFLMNMRGPGGPGGRRRSRFGMFPVPMGGGWTGGGSSGGWSDGGGGGDFGGGGGSDFGGGDFGGGGASGDW